MSLKSLKIAVVDDDQIYQFIIHRTLIKLDPDSKILNFSNCNDFFNFLKRNTYHPLLVPDLVLLDLNTPFMNGWEFLEAYKEIKDTLLKVPEIYMITSSVDPNDVERAKVSHDLVGFYIKPLRPEQVQQIMHEVLVKNM